MGTDSSRVLQLRRKRGGRVNLPNDQDQRDRFRDELDDELLGHGRAGSGKTRAITDRIAAIAEHERAREWLPTWWW